MVAPLKVGIAGLGTVGAEVVRLIEAQQSILSARCGRGIKVVAVTARNKAKKRGVDLRGIDWMKDPLSVATHPEVECFVELMGGAGDPALASISAALAAGKSVVTANKALVAKHGLKLATLAEKHGGALNYEAAVAGAIPIIKTLREGLSGTTINRVYGILNGTCNYILTRMEQEGLSFEECLKDAQRLGYAEAEPSFDVDGYDTAQKLAILASLAFGTQPAFGDVAITGVRHVIAADIAEAAALGYRVRLLGVADAGPHGLFQRVHPHLVPVSHPLAHVTGSTNAVVAEGNFVGRLLFQGAGAGDGPTASAVVADLIDIARGEFGPPYAMPADALAAQEAADSGERRGRAYLRFTVADKVGVLAEIAAAMRDAGVSIESLIQRGASADGSVLVAIVTHEAPERAVAQALERLRGSQSLTGQPLWMHILE